VTANYYHCSLLDNHHITLNLDNQPTVTPPTKPDQFPDPLLQEFEQRVNHLITEAYSSETQETAHIALLADGLEELSQQAIDIGDLAHTHPFRRLFDYFRLVGTGKIFFIIVERCFV